MLSREVKDFYRFFVQPGWFISAIFGWPKGWICDTGWHFHGPTVTHWLLLGGWPAPRATPSLYLTQRGFFQSRASITPFAHRSVRARCSSYWNVFTRLCLSFSIVVVYSSHSHTQCTWIMGKSFLCIGHGQDFLLGLSALVDCPDAWSSELSIQKAPRRNKNSWLPSVGPLDSPNNTVYTPIQWRKALLSGFLI